MSASVSAPGANQSTNTDLNLAADDNHTGVIVSKILKIFFLLKAAFKINLVQKYEEARAPGLNGNDASVHNNSYIYIIWLLM